MKTNNIEIGMEEDASKESQEESVLEQFSINLEKIRRLIFDPSSQELLDKQIEKFKISGDIRRTPEELEKMVRAVKQKVSTWFWHGQIRAMISGKQATYFESLFGIYIEKSQQGNFFKKFEVSLRSQDGTEKIEETPSIYEYLQGFCKGYSSWIDFFSNGKGKLNPNAKKEIEKYQEKKRAVQEVIEVLDVYSKVTQNAIKIDKALGLDPTK